MHICEWDKAGWDNFIDESPQGTVFCKSVFLESYRKPVKYLVCKKGDEIFGGFGFVYDGNNILQMPFNVYSGIIFKDLSNYDLYHQNKIIFSVMEVFADYLFKNYDKVEICNHYNITDIRAFDWYNYNEQQNGFYKISIRYTSLLDISKPKDISGYSRLRTRDLDKGISISCFRTEESQDVELLNRLHENNFIRQNIVRPFDESDYLNDICGNLLKTNRGKLYITYVDNEPAAASFFIFDRFRTYHLFTGSKICLRDLGIGTKNLYESCISLNRDLGIKELDMVGVNSPNRGFYKLSYGGILIPYYTIKKICKEEN